MNLSDHRREVSFCAYCPKLCRFACPVANVEKRETVTPWGKMSAAYLHLKGTRPIDGAAAEVLYACTGCMRCRENCKHENEVGPSLFAARAEAVQAGLAPAAAQELPAHWPPQGLEEAAREVERLLPEGVAFFPGCAAIRRGRAAVEGAGEASRLLKAPLKAVAAELCCGYPLWAAGQLSELERTAKKLSQRLAGHSEIVVGDPGCAYMLAKIYPQMGLKVPRVRTLIEHLLPRAEQAAAQRPPLAETITYHDACYLGRGMGQFEEPRRLLRLAVRKVLEAPESREDGGCSGGGGLLPETRPQTAVGMARAWVEEAPAGTPVVTACSSARRMLERGGAQAYDLAAIVARWLRGPPST